MLFAREGANVLLADLSEDGLTRAFSKIRDFVVPKPTQKIESKICDVSKEADVRAAIYHVDRWGGIDILFNTAGILHFADADAITTSEAVWDLTQSINVKGTLFGSKYAVLSMRKNKKTQGSVINTAKGAILAMTRELAMVHAREGIRFNSLCPGPLNTPLQQDWLGDDEQKRARRTIHFPTGRFGEAVEQAYAVLFLASDESGFITGQDFVVDGGMTKAYVTSTDPATVGPLNLASQYAKIKAKL
ncbi:hypothetical protein B7463_g7750, partial [Scytalidium lignicola]